MPTCNGWITRKKFIDDYSIERSLLNAFDIGYEQAAGEQVYIDYTKFQ
jgi:hypothetical protein